MKKLFVLLYILNTTIWHAVRCSDNNTVLQEYNQSLTPALLEACGKKNIRVVDHLLASGANPSAPNAQGLSPLMIATLKNSNPIMTGLLDYGADVNYADSNGITALHIACRKKNIKNVCCLMSYGANPNIPRAQGRTPLIIAARNGSHNIVTTLRTYGANVNYVTPDGKTALKEACQQGHVQAAECLLGHIQTENGLIVSYGANINYQNEYNDWTALMIACKTGNIDLIRLLIKNGAYPYQTDKKGRNSFDIVPAHLQNQCFPFLIAYQDH